MSETCKRRCLIVGMGGISRGMHASLRTKPCEPAPVRWSPR
jgi:hypothetical protein